MTDYWIHSMIKIASWHKAFKASRFFSKQGFLHLLHKPTYSSNYAFYRQCSTINDLLIMMPWRSDMQSFDSLKHTSSVTVWNVDFKFRIRKYSTADKVFKPLHWHSIAFLTGILPRINCTNYSLYNLAVGQNSKFCYTVMLHLKTLATTIMTVFPEESFAGSHLDAYIFILSWYKTLKYVSLMFLTIYTYRVNTRK